MSSLQSLIEGGGDCGAANPVVELARQFTQSTSSSAVAEDPTTSLLRDIHHPETLVGQQQSQGHQQQQPIGASFSAAAAAQHLLNSSRSSVQQLEQQHQQNSNSTPFDMNLLLEQMREMDSAMERAMKRGHDQQDQQEGHHHHLGDLGEVLGDELAGGGGKLSGSTDPFLGSASLEDGGGGWEEALKLNDNETSSSSSAAVDFGVFGGHPPSSSSLIDESWEEALLATVGTPDVLLSAEETGAGNNWVDEYFRTLDAQVDRQEEAEEAAHQAERQSYRGRSIAATTEDGQELKNVTGGGPGFDDFSAFFQSMSSTIDRVASSKAPSSSSQLPQGVRAEVTFNLSELVSDQEERLMNMLLSGGGGGAFQEEDEDIVTSSAAKQLDPDELLNLDAIGRKEEEEEEVVTESQNSSDFKMPSSLLNSTTSPQESQRQQQQQSQPQPQKPEEKFFYENQFDDMEFWMKLAEEWEHSSNPLDLEAALNEATAKQPAVPVVHEPLEELLKPDHLHHYHFVLENPFLKVEEEEEEENVVQESSEAMKTDEAKEDEENDDFEEYIRRGLAKLEVGDIPAAILLFEAAAATAPSSARAWLLLGTAQAKNENDRKAIGAMKRCLALDPANLEALLCLAISFTNESQTAEACAALREWLAAHPKYGHLLEEAEAEAMEEKAKKESENEQQQQQQYMGPTPLWKRWGAGSTSATANSSANIFESGLFERIKGVFIRAATETTAETMDTAEDQQGAAGEQRLPDADVQCGLGVLFSLSGDYEKAADCFRTAVAVRPQEHTLWNRLGATLANGGHSAQAMAAYREALVRYPGYIRARHNLAIACLMLGAEREAVGHLLAVLNLQTAGSRSAAEGGGGGEAAAKSSALAEIIANPSSITSAAVWSLLRTALLALNREDLFPAVGDRNLALLNREFSFGEQEQEEEQEKSSAED